MTDDIETGEFITIKKRSVPQEFRKEGMLRRLLRFESGVRDVAIYEVLRENFPHIGHDAHRGYEVMVVKYTTQDNEDYGKVVGSPILPSNEQFGYTGWHYNNFERAEKKFNELLLTPLKKGVIKSKYVFI